MVERGWIGVWMDGWSDLHGEEALEGVGGEGLEVRVDVHLWGVRKGQGGMGMHVDGDAVGGEGQGGCEWDEVHVGCG